ncbi:helix-turn-helix domain-containing protein [Nesterenkonia jeotgali]|uniref:helix-turn-helix domain-containing protein n=1 Tax=Nesterenkonia jeotgali TaxID=317018 RepID=UPI0039F2386D
MVDASELLWAALKHAGITQAALAEKLGVRKSEVHARLAGDRNITVRKLADTLHALGHELILDARPAPTDEEVAAKKRAARNRRVHYAVDQELSVQGMLRHRPARIEPSAAERVAHRMARREPRPDIAVVRDRLAPHHG